jgi:hypothetical protein
VRPTSGPATLAAALTAAAALTGWAPTAGAEEFFDPASCTITTEGPAHAPSFAAVDCNTGSTRLVLTGDPAKDRHASTGAPVGASARIVRLDNGAGPDRARQLRVVLETENHGTCVVFRDLATGPERTTVECRTS